MNSGVGLKRKMNASFKKTLVISLIIHIVIVFINIHERSQTDKLGSYNQQKSKTITVKLAPNDDRKKRQIVKTENKGNEKINDNTKYLSEFDRTVSKESVAAGTGKFNKAGIGRRDGQEKVSVPAPPQIKKITKKDTNPESKLAKLAQLTQAMDVAVPTPKVQPTSSVAKGLKNGDLKSRGMSSTSDFVEDVPLGDFTELNTKRFKYFSFYDRIRKQLENHWGRNIRQKARRLFSRGGRLPASENFITSLRIVLDSKGNIINVLINSSSGIRELDEAAVDSFNKAGPFPNPPQELVKNGSAVIEWGFVVNS